MFITDQVELGLQVATWLRGSWRAQPPMLTDERSLRETLPLLCRGGAAGLTWWRVRNSALADSPIADELRAAYRQFRLSARIHEQEICDIFTRLREFDIEPVLIKGWAIARRYPDAALRPYGDIDICVRPDQFQAAIDAVKYFENRDSHYVDLHQGFDSVGHHALNSKPRAGDRQQASWDDVFKRTTLVALGNHQIRIVSEEDHLRILCQHFLRSGGWRPLSLVDIALALETARADFDWDICLGRNPIHANWVKCVVGLAEQLLGAEVRGQRSEVSTESGRRPTTDDRRALSWSAFDRPNTQHPTTYTLPRWLAPAVLRQWGRCQNPSTVQGTLPTLLDLRSHPRELLREIHARWDNPIRSTARLRGAYNGWPRAPYQILEIVQRMRAEVPKQLLTILETTRECDSQFAIRNPQFD